MQALRLLGISGARSGPGSKFFLQILLALLLVNLFTVGLLVYAAFDYNKRAATRHAKENIAQQVNILATRFEESFRRILDQSLARLIHSQGLDDYLLGSVAERLILRRNEERQYLRLLKSQPDFHSIRFFDADGRLAIGVENGRRITKSLNLGTPSDGKDPSVELHHTRTVFQELIDTPLLLSSGNMEFFMPKREMRVLGPFEGSGGVIKAFAALSKLDIDTGRVGGVMIIEVRFDNWINQLRSLKFFDQDPVWILDAYGVPLSNPDAKTITFDPRPFTEDGFQAATRLADAAPGFIAYRDLSVSPGQIFMRVAIALPHELLTRDFQSAARFFYLVLAISVALLVVISYVISRYLAKPVMALQTTRNRLSDAQRIARLGHWWLELDEPLSEQMIFLSEHASSVAGLGPAAESMRLGKFTELVHADDRAGFLKMFREIGHGVGTGSLEHRLTTLDGQTRYVRQEIELELGSPHRLLGTIQDISVRKDYEERIRQLAYFDPITGLANRTTLIESIETAIENAAVTDGKIAIIFIDLDNFKKINDTVGHAAGDELLRQVGRRLRTCVRPTDTVGKIHEERHSVARLGGDEFVILLDRLDGPQAAEKVAHRIKNLLAQCFNLSGKDVFISGSLGISLYPDNSQSVSELLKQADAAMYCAKAQGRDRFVFYSDSIDREIQRRLSLETHLHRALDQDEFEVYYQPRMSLESNRLVSVEALLRWNDPERGLVFPGEFIPIAEESGFIVPIGEWVLWQACRQMREWQAKFEDPGGISINLSPVQFASPEFRERFGLLMDEFHDLSQLIELELTENMLFENVEESVEITREMKNRGIKISIDDFGTGYSSLQLLKQFPVDTLKIDRSFICDLEVDRDDALIVETAIGLGRNLGMRVVAEGVETDAQLEFLRHHRCHEIQGYWFGRPQPVEQIEKMFRRKTDND